MRGARMRITGASAGTAPTMHGRRAAHDLFPLLPPPPHLLTIRIEGSARVILEDGTPRSLLAPRSHRRRYSIATDPPRATLQRSIGLLNRDDEDFCTRLEIALVPRHVNNNGRIGGDKDFLFSVLVF